MDRMAARVPADDEDAPAEGVPLAVTHGHDPHDTPGASRGMHADPPRAAGGHADHGERHGGRHEGHSTADFRRRFWVSLALTVPILLLSPPTFLFERGIVDAAGIEYLVLALASAVYVYGGWPFLRGLVREVTQAVPGMMTLVAVAITTAYGYSAAVVFGLGGEPFFWELATLIDIMLLGHWVEMRSIGAASRALEELARLMPSEAHRLLPDGGIEDVALEALAPGDRVLVRPGERVPADGAVEDGASAVNEAMLTGESVPVQKGAGDEVVGGAVNGEGALVVRVEKTGADSFLSQVVDLVRQAQESKSRTQDLADRAALVLTIVALSGGALTFVLWLLASAEPGSFALERAVTVMVIACPHALGLAIPLVVAVSTAIGAHRGLLVRERAAFEHARLVDTVVFDKTGTLTLGSFGVSDVAAYDGADEEHVLALAAAVEANSEHPIARAIASVAGERLDEAPPATEGFRALPGRGAQADVDGRSVAVVSPGYLTEQGIALPDGDGFARLSEAGKTVVYVLVEGRPVGSIGLADVVRDESREAIRRLRARGVRAVMLTGDNAKVAASVAKNLGIEEVFAEVLPGDKAAKVRELQAQGRLVAMVGDGVNDAPALAQADVGIAVGAGTDVAVETADIVLVRDDPRDVVGILDLAGRTYRKMAQNLLWATGYNVVAIPLAAGALAWAGVVLEPAVGAALMSVSTVIVALNSRLLRD
jgi:Cu2+-exporting ATPase